VIHELPLERRTLHGHFSRDLEPVVTVDPGDTVAFACLDAGWHVRPDETFEPRDPELDEGHAVVVAEVADIGPDDARARLEQIGRAA
jgi:acetamidase/formamidase